MKMTLDRRLDMVQKPTRDFKMTGLESSEGLPMAVLPIECQNEALVAKAGNPNLWHETVGHCNDKVLSASLPHRRGVSEKEPTKTIECQLHPFRKPYLEALEICDFWWNIAAKPTRTYILMWWYPMKTSLCRRLRSSWPYATCAVATQY